VKEAISVGDLVEVDLKTGVPAFQGKVLSVTPCPVTYEQVWYKVKPNEPGAMPANYWYKDTEVKKAGGEDVQEAKTAEESVSPSAE